MNATKTSVKNISYPSLQNFGDSLDGNDEFYFGEKMIVMHATKQMLLKTIGDGSPYYLHNTRIGLYTQGTVDSQINLEERQVKKGTLEFYGPGTLFQLHNASPDFRAFEIIIDSSYIGELLGGNLPPLFRLKAASIHVNIDIDEQERFCQMMRLLLYFAKTEGELNPVTRSMVQTILRFTLSLFTKHTRERSQPLTRQEIIFHEFARLVTLSRGRHRVLSYYAEQLNVSVHYLSLAVSRSSGVTAKDWINRAVMTEVKLMLVHSDYTIAQIALELDFPSDSFLCKFFRRHVGMSPLEFRRAYK